VPLTERDWVHGYHRRDEIDQRDADSEMPLWRPAVAAVMTTLECGANHPASVAAGTAMQFSFDRASKNHHRAPGVLRVRDRVALGNADPSGSVGGRRWRRRSPRRR
jgi:hypothetical protein